MNHQRVQDKDYKRIILYDGAIYLVSLSFTGSFEESLTEGHLKMCTLRLSLTPLS